MRGRPGFVSILRGIEDAYRNRPADVEKTANQLVTMLQQFAVPGTGDAVITIDDVAIQGLIRQSIDDYDPRHGGFGGAPKFPRETLLELLLVYIQTPAPDAPLKARVGPMLFHTLDALAFGGIRDHLGGGFHRYSTDAHWLVPHFEIMLYDNAMLAWCYVEAFRQTKDARYESVARGIFDFVLREMTSPAGLFYTAFDAEVDSQEGLNYLWTKDEVADLLRAKLGDGPREKERIARFLSVYGLDAGPNFADPHHGTGIPDKNILFLAHTTVTPSAPPHEVAERSALLDPDLASLRQILLEARMKRKQPLLDTKIITGWNALMIRALAFGGQILGDPHYTAAAARAADRLLVDHRSPNGGLHRTSRDGVAKYPGFLDDYSFLIQSLLALETATGDGIWKQRAGDLATIMLEKFGDPQFGGFFFTEKDASDLIVRQKTGTDSPLPSGAAIAAIVLLELGHVAHARNTLWAFAHQMESQGGGMSAMVQAALQYVRKAGPFTISPDSRISAETRPQAPHQTARDVVNASAAWAGPQELRVRLSITSGYHINAHDLSADLGLITTTLTVRDDPTAVVEYPRGEELTLNAGTLPTRVYSGNIEITVRLSSPPNAGQAVQMSLVYQACDDSACLPPTKIQIAL